MPSDWREGRADSSLLVWLRFHEAVLELAGDVSADETLAGDVTSERFEREGFC